MTNRKKALEHLEELLNIKNEQIEKLTNDVRVLENNTESSEWGWMRHRDIPAMGLPVPRLELFVTPRRNNDYLTGTLWIRRLVIAQEHDQIVAVPLTAATSTWRYGPEGRPSVQDRVFPSALFAEISFDTGHLGLHAYRVVEYWKTPKSKPSYEAKLIDVTKVRGSHHHRGLKARK